MTAGWLDGYGPEVPQAPAQSQAAAPKAPAKDVAPQPTAWKQGQRRILVEVICCEKCGSTALRRRDEYGEIAYWHCEECQSRQKESKNAGRAKSYRA